MQSVCADHVCNERDLRDRHLCSHGVFGVEVLAQVPLLLWGTLAAGRLDSRASRKQNILRILLDYMLVVAHLICQHWKPLAGS